MDVLNREEFDSSYRPIEDVAIINYQYYYN